VASSIPVIGISGGIGSGKTTVAKLLAELGCVVTHSDEDGRAALRDPQIRETIVAWWGRGVLDEHGEIDRSAVAHIVFDDPAQRTRLESLTHPWIETRRRERWASAPPGAPALVIDAPLLHEAGLDAVCDAIIYVQTDRSRRLGRVRDERGWDEAELLRREDSQMPLDEKRSKADYVVENDGDLESLAQQVHRILDEIVKKHRKGPPGSSSRSLPSSDQSRRHS
jgi:dephospho-CoA kinase